MNEYNVINTSQKKSDWNANEGEAGYIKNRTHYETVNETEVTHTFTIPDDYSDDIYEETNPEDDAIIQALYNTYVADAEDTIGNAPVFISSGKININETENNCYLYLLKKSSGSFWVVLFLDKEVDASSQEEIVTERIFSVGKSSNGDIAIIYTISHFNIGQNEISCTVPQTTVKKIDPKFLPDMGGGLNNAKDAENGGIVEGLINGEEGQVNVASGSNAHAEGGQILERNGQTVYAISTASGAASHAEGSGTTASGNYSHAEGDTITASNYASHAEGLETTALGEYSHAEGNGTVTSGTDSHAEGYQTTASNESSHAEGISTTASGEASHAEGDGTTASGAYSHAEGYHLTASGMYSHAEGVNTTASGNSSHAEGGGTTASGVGSHAEGSHTIANHRNQHVFGEYNIQDPSTAAIGNRGTYVEIVGNGSSNNNKSNARTLDWDGNEVLSGKLTVGTQPTNDNDVATKKYVDDHSGGGALICTLNPNVSPRVLDHTFGEIYNALRSGRPVFMDDVMYGTIRSISQFIYASEQPNLYYIRFSDQAWNFLSGSIDDYPTEDLD